MHKATGDTNHSLSETLGHNLLILLNSFTDIFKYESILQAGAEVSFHPIYHKNLAFVTGNEQMLLFSFFCSYLVHA